MAQTQPVTTDARVVINLMHANQQTAEIFLRSLFALEEGVPCSYHIQLGQQQYEPALMSTVLDFVERKKAQISYALPDIPFPQELIDEEDQKTFEGNVTRLSKWQLKKQFELNLCLYKYIQEMDSFLFLDTNSVPIKNRWLELLHGQAQKSGSEVFGHLRHGRVRGQERPSRWSTCAWYNGASLRTQVLPAHFTERIENPWWKYRNEPDTARGNLCFIKPWFSGFDVSLDHLLFALMMSKRTESIDPFCWSRQPVEDHGNVIVSADPVECDGEIRPESAILYNIQVPQIQEKMLRFHYRTASERKAQKVNAPALKKYPLSGPRYHLIGDNDRLLKITDLKDMFLGERCFIIGNGPSLKKTDMRLLKGDYTIGLNRIYLNHENMGFEPTFLCIANPNVIEQFHTDIDRLNSIKFIRYQLRQYIENRWNNFFMESYGFHDFNTDLSDLKWCEGTTVTYCAMQVAYYLGFKTVILIGVDHSFSNTGKPHQLVTAQGADENHFHPDYFGKGVKWQYPDLKRSEISYRVARNVYEKDGRRILDATVGGKLQVFPKIDYAEIFKGSGLPPVKVPAPVPALPVEIGSPVVSVPTGPVPSAPPVQIATPPVSPPARPSPAEMAIPNTRLTSLRNKHANQRCVIIGNGPSLNRMDLSFLRNEISFGMNRIFLNFNAWGFRPTYYAAINPLVIMQSAREIASMPLPRFISTNGYQYLSPLVKDGIIYLKSIYRPFFSMDPAEGIYEGYTVTYAVMQLAYYMGFREVVLIGVDHSYSAQGAPNQQVVSLGPDRDHCNPEYFGKGFVWNLPDLQQSELSYRMARETFEADGRRILDATVDGKLTVFDKVNYREYFAKPFVPAADAAPRAEVMGSSAFMDSVTSLTEQGKWADAFAYYAKHRNSVPATPQLMEFDSLMQKVRQKLGLPGSS